MKLSTLLVKNSLKSVGKSKFMMFQLGILLTVGTTIMSTVFLSNSSLSDRLDEINNQSNTADFSIKNVTNDNIVNYDILVGDKNINDFTKDLVDFSEFLLVSQPTKIYNPLVSTQFNIPFINDPTKNIGNFYGFGIQYSTNNQNPGNWSNVIYDDKNFPVTFNTDLSNQNYKDKVSHFFSIYNDILPPSLNRMVESNYEILYDVGLYATNPWSFRVDTNSNLSVSRFGNATLDGFDNSISYKLTNSILYNDLAYFVSTSNTFLTPEQEQLIPNINQLKENADKGIYFYDLYDDLMAVYYQLEFSPTSNNLPLALPKSFIEFIKLTSNDLAKNYFYESPAQLSLTYKLDYDNLNGQTKILYESFMDNEDEAHAFLNEPKNKKYFEGTIKIPLIPYQNIRPKQNLTSPEDYKKWILNPSEWINNSIIDIQLLKRSLVEATNSLKNLTLEWAKELYKDPNYGEHFNKLYNRKYNIKYNLENGYYDNLEEGSKGMLFSESKNFYINDSETNNYVISTSINSITNKPINKLLTFDGQPLISNELLDSKLNIFELMTQATDKFKNSVNPIEIRDYFVNNKDYCKTILNIMSKSNWFVTDKKKQEIASYFDKVFNEELMYKNLDLWINNIRNTPWLQTWEYTGYGYKFSVYWGDIHQTAEYVDPTAFLVNPSINYSKLKNNEKLILDDNIINQALQLPYCNIKDITIEEVNNNPWKYKNNFITNPLTGKKEFYKDFLTWKNSLDDRYKLSINNNEFIINGTSISSEFLYPIASSNQLLINNNIPIIFTNDLGFNFLHNGQSYQINSYYWVKYNSNFSITNNRILNNINEQSMENYNQKIAYDVNDSSQPNKLLYLRINYPYTILNLIFTITLIIGLIILFLAIIFIFILLRTITKQNINNFAIAMSQGANKQQLVLSFLVIGVIQGAITSIIGYVASIFIYPLISRSIESYWILDFINYGFNFWYWLVIFLISTAFICLCLYISVLFTLRKPTHELLQNTGTWKHNKLISYFNKAFSKLPIMHLFRINYILSNLSKFFILLFMMATFVTLTTVYASSQHIFTTSLEKTSKNKLYTYAFDLYSPTQQGGYYYNIPYNLIGSRQQGLVGLHDFENNTTIYGSSYKDALTQTNDFTGQTMVYENMFLPSLEVMNDLKYNIQFLRNKVLTIGMLDVYIELGNISVNPLDFAMRILPNSLSNKTLDLMQKQIEDAFKYFVWASKNINNDEKYLWSKDAINAQTTVWDQISRNDKLLPVSEWNQTYWYFQYKMSSDGIYRWTVNYPIVSTGIPNLLLDKQYLKLWTTILSFENNKNYRQYLETNNMEFQNHNFFLALNIIPFESVTDETYTYIQGLNLEAKREFKIKGIKPNSNHIILWDEYNGIDLKTKLQEYETKFGSKPINDGEEVYYPLIINEVVSKKYGIYLNDNLSFEVLNTFDRFTKKAKNLDPNVEAKFKVIGITTSKSEEQLYTTQTVANKILGYKSPELATSTDLLTNNYDNKWINQEEINNYIPFNGVFTKAELPNLITGIASMYSFSGINPISGELIVDYLSNGYILENILANLDQINKVLHVDNFIPQNASKTWATVREFVRKYVDVFGTNDYFTTSVSDVDIGIASLVKGDLLDNTISKIMDICSISLIPSILIIVVLMAYIMVIESKRLVALLKVLGYSTWTNTLTLTGFQFALCFVGLGLGMLVSLIVLKILQTFTFNNLMIIINPQIVWWVALVSLLSLLLIVSSVAISIFLYLRKVNPAQEIAVRI